MKRGVLAAAAISAALWLTGCIDGSFGMAFHDDVSVTRPLSASGSFSLENTNGRVHVASWGEPRVRIEASKGAGSRRALERLEVVIEGEGDHVTVRTRQPHGGFLFHGGGKVDYSITVPRGAQVSVRNVNGRVEIDGVTGGVRAGTTNGSVELSDLGGEVDASTTNGSVEVKLIRVAPTSRNRLSTTNGSVRLTLPRDVQAEIEAHTVNGGIHCDFDLASGARVSRRRLEGRIGNGGARFELRTVNGAARIDRGFASDAASVGTSPAEAAPATPAAR
jgi:hypothetical protein